MTNRSHNVRRHGTWLAVAPAIIAVAVASAACSPGEEPAPADATYSTPAVFTGQPDPSLVNQTGTNQPAAEGHGEPGAQPTTGAEANGFTGSMRDLKGNQIGTAALSDQPGAMKVAVELSGSNLGGGIYQVGITDNGECTASTDFESSGNLRSLGDDDAPTTLTLPVSSNGDATMKTFLPDVGVQTLGSGDGSAVVLVSPEHARVACASFTGA